MKEWGLYALCSLKLNENDQRLKVERFNFKSYLNKDRNLI